MVRGVRIDLGITITGLHSDATKSRCLGVCTALPRVSTEAQATSASQWKAITSHCATASSLLFSRVHAILIAMKRVASAALWPRLRTLQIYGANTGVGKTIFSTVLCRAFQRKLQRVQYVKPVSTGPLDDADDRYAFLVHYQGG